MKLVILGAGGYGRTIADIALSTGHYEEVFFLDDAAGSDDQLIKGKLADFGAFLSADTEFYPAIGNNRVRLEWLDRLQAAGASIASIIHNSAYVSTTAIVGIGTMVLPHAIVGTGVKLGDGCIVNLGAIVDHDCVIGRGCHIAPGAIVKGSNYIPDLEKVESGTVIETGTWLPA